MKFETDDNPWCVDNLNVFLYFCCPECDVKDPSKEIFVKHALEEHPKFKENYENFIKMEYDNLDNNQFHEIFENKSSSSSKRKRKQKYKLKQNNNEKNNSNDLEIEPYNEFNNDEIPELNSSKPKPLVVAACVPNLIPDVIIGLSVSYGIPFLLHVIFAASKLV